MIIERLGFFFDHCPKCMSENIEGGMFLPRDGFHFEQIECYNCGHRYEVKAKISENPTVFDRITASPEVLAKELVTTSYDEFKDCTVYWAWLGNGRREAYYSKPEAIAATVEKLKEVEK